MSVREEVDTELGFHVDMRTQYYIERGMSPTEARAAALSRFGSVEHVTRTCRTIGEGRDREMRRSEWLADFRQDVVFALRQLRRAPAFTTVALVTLMLGIGATSAIFSVVNGVLLRPLPLTEPDRVVRIYEGDNGGPTSALNFLDWCAQSRSFSGLAAFTSTSANLSGNGEPERLNGAAVSANFFSVIGAGVVLGRAFAPGDDEPGASHVAMLSYDLWRRRFGADSGIVGRVITLDGEATTIIGIARPETAVSGQTVSRQAEIWLPLVFPPEERAATARGHYHYRVYGRLAPGASITEAQRELTAIVGRLAQQYPDAFIGRDHTIRVVQLQRDIVGDARTPLLVLLGAVMLVLLIACANVANLLLVRAAGRETEIAVRTAIGAGRGRIARQLLTESMILSVVAGVLGAALGWAAVRTLTALGPSAVPRLDNVHLDARVLAFTALVTVLTGVVFGLAPAIYASRSDLTRSLRSGTRGSGGRAGSGRLRSALVVAELTLSLMLLAGAGLLIKSFHRLALIDLGFRTDHVMTFVMDLPVNAYRTDESVRPFITATTERLQHLPGVRSAALVSSMPMGETGTGGSFSIPGHPQPPGSVPIAFMSGVTSDFLSVLRIPLVSGRGFLPTDRDGNTRVAVINRALAERYFPGENPVGQALRVDGLDDSTGAPRQIVGVIGDTKMFALTEPRRPMIYLPLMQNPARYLYAVVRTSGDPVSIMPAARAAVHEIAPDLPIAREMPMDKWVDLRMREPRFYTLLLTIFAGVALVLASVGIYGVMSYAVSQETRELGIRIALGADRGSVLRLIVGRGARLALGGLVAGLGGAIALSRVMSSLLYEVAPTDVPTYVAVAALLTLVALLACAIPARRAARVDPAITLRGE
jgi:predicted permease